MSKLQTARFQGRATQSGNLRSQQFPVTGKRAPVVHLFSIVAQLRNIHVHVWTPATPFEGLFAFNKSLWEEHPGVLVVIRTQSLHRGQMAPTPPLEPLSRISLFLIIKRSEWFPTPFWIHGAHTLGNCKRTKPASAQIILHLFPSFEDSVMP